MILPVCSGCGIIQTCMKKNRLEKNECDAKAMPLPKAPSRIMFDSERPGRFLHKVQRDELRMREDSMV